MAEQRYRASLRYGRGRFFLNRAHPVEVQIFDKGEPRNCSAVTEVVRFRVWKKPNSTSYLGGATAGDLAMTKQLGTADDPGGVSSTAGDTGIVRVTFTPRALADEMKCEVVITDTAVADTTTRSGFKELLVEEPWDSDVSAAGPQA
jgi:hypothetical protein